ncbi:MAG: cation:proton antiporter [Tenericutes bacterium GWC2_34_14]|nr:MAG: cation:proton antiporter [Tenericutes bacterium GWC2_34_14]OHE33317.1 MAG: cation:proton antiporter [Tenericutes bacterium GWE2_34_108]OHE36468.1 MAG: cation:proton antiporter [Tenericutes bacterium GWF1_35_14]OHE37672.1 MAG: cation:proton antiporter [Tenericutes bacterium GWF2_35_184]OHE45051.1 MAG: cation:proton antiporter [Tenericutes bacterium RIFOXYA2_FULL_36_32]OHE45851.1 MAG: cation:proton antiporter [Tenericutes bacterium RIFOXYA12_FULL_35_10]OHE49055.1 MAG: cation:proton anti
MIQYAAIFLFALGFYGLFVNKNIIKLIVSLNVMEIGLFLFIISIGFVSDGIAPIVSSVDDLGLIYVDPIPQALVLTAIVIGVGTTALGLALSKNIFDTYHTLELDELEAIQ